LNRRPIVAVIAAMALLGAQAQAQQAPAKPPAATPPAAPTPVAPPPPPYEPQLMRLAEIMGALAYLRDICGAHDSDAFHDKVAALLEIEARTTERKERLAGAYNRGFHDYERAYRNCTPAAQEIVRRFLEETAHISGDIAGRYGG
jgi:uncharacterized protein (TIGR02301 family)